jgi:hypothetical protein
MPRCRTWAGEMKRSDRIFAIELRNRGRVRHGTATVWRWAAILEAIKRRHADSSISPKYTWRITVRSRKAGARLGDVQGYQTTLGGGEARAHEMTLDEAIP